MQIVEIPTDDTLRSTLEHGTPAFPFEHYLDELGRFKGRCIEWHWHSGFEFSTVLRGTIRCRVGAGETALSAGGGLFVNSGAIHRFDTEDDGVMATLIFAPEFISPPGVRRL